MNNDRWNIAQEYEKNWWDTRKENVSLEFYRHFAEDLTEHLQGIFEIKKDTVTLEIGSGAAGTITFLDSEEKYAIDPLEYYYSTVEQFTKDRDSRVRYYSAKGENLPFDNLFFDLIIIDNVLDHCDDPEKVIKEMYRVIKKEGIIFLRQNTYHFWGVFIRNRLEKFTFDKGHPYTFSKKILKNYIEREGFIIVKYSRNGYFKTWIQELFAFRKKEFIKAMLFATRDKTTYILRKEY